MSGYIYFGSGYLRGKTFPPYKYPKILNPCYSSYLPAYEEGKGCSETSAYQIHTLGNYSEGIMKHSEQGESLKSKVNNLSVEIVVFRCNE